jgi:nitrite reductase (NO-forming)
MSTTSRIRVCIVAGFAVAGCSQPSKPPAPEQTAAPTAAPANVSHGEAEVGSTVTPPPVDPVAPAPSRSRLVRVHLEIMNAKLTVDSGIIYDGWTFGGHSPGPVIRATQGDTIDFTLVNKAPMPHSMDFHAAEIAPSKYYTNVMPGDSIHYRFVARVPGAFLYHCGTAPVAAHIANGMFGALIVDPAQPRPAAREFVFVQSEFYVSPSPAGTAGAFSLSWEKVLNQAPDYVVFNGRVAQYAKHPIKVPVNGLLRLYVVNAGPNRISSFHIVGAIFERAYLDGSTSHPLEGVQTVNVPVGGSSIFEVRLREPGTYPFVTHAFADATKGAVGMFEAEPSH